MAYPIFQGFSLKGPFNNYVDGFYAFFDQLPTPRRQFIYYNLFTNVEIWLSTHSPHVDSLFTKTYLLA